MPSKPREREFFLLSTICKWFSPLFYSPHSTVFCVVALSLSALDINPPVLSIFLFHTFFRLPPKPSPESFCSSVVVLVAKSGERGGGERRKKEQNVKPHILGVANDAGVCRQQQKKWWKKINSRSLSSLCIRFFFFQPLQPMKSPLVGWFTLTYGLCCLCCREWWCFYAELALFLSSNIHRTFRSPFAHMLCPQSGGKESKNFEKSCGFFWKRKKKAYRPQIPTRILFPLPLTYFSSLLLWGEYFFHFFFLYIFHITHSFDGGFSQASRRERSIWFKSFGVESGSWRFSLERKTSRLESSEKI